MKMPNYRSTATFNSDEQSMASSILKAEGGRESKPNGKDTHAWRERAAITPGRVSADRLAPA